MRRQLYTDQVSLEALQNTAQREHHVNIRYLIEFSECKNDGTVITPVALCVNVSLFSTPKTCIL